ncbi:endosome-associated-trafficking regulator 1-like isoform X2 [Rhopilema esculentum]|uniref:endosome-associated-trafficking regulator 1-like isoform X2 n=1 Tax=Rhopilema esculentum TaxID=499914 RepID=UPI0031CEFC5C
MARSCEDLTSSQSEPDNNPFLFSNFLKKEPSEVETAQVWKTFDSSNESVDQAPFPDLCLNKKALKKKTKSNGKDKRTKENKSETKRRVLKIVDDEIQTVDDKEIDEILELNSKLENENKSLKEKVMLLEKEVNSERETSKKRINNLVEELKAVKKRELEETATLENVVQMVEENLRQTTQRALKAEATVSKMKEEVKFLKEETISKTKHHQIIEEYEFTLKSIREKAKDSSKLMRVAADKTEPILKELLTGISSLRLFAEQFESIDKIAEIDPTRDRVV